MVSINHRSPLNSGSLDCNATSYSVPENCFSFSAICLICRPVRILGALNFANSRIASCALWLASEARASASATFSSDLRCNSRCRAEPILLKSTSPATPRATKESAITAPQIPANESKGGWQAARATSMTKPIITAIPPCSAARSHDFMDSRNSSFVAFITPFMRRNPGKGPLWRPLWIGVSGGLLIAAAIMYLSYLLQ